MAIRIPKMNRQYGSTEMTVGRSQVQAPNLVTGSDLQMNAISNVVEDQFRFFDAQEKARIDTTAKSISNEYRVYLNQELQKAKTYQGDPMDVYQNFDKSMNEKYNELLTKHPDLSERAKSALSTQLNEVATDYKTRADTAYYGQYYDYDRDTTKSTVKLLAQDLMDEAAYINPEDPKSFKKIDDKIRNISNTYKNHGEKFGMVTRDENGNQVSSSVLDVEIGKEISDSIVGAIKNLNDARRPDLADAMYTKYSKYIDVNKKDDLRKLTLKELDDKKIYETVEKTRTMTPDQVSNYLDKTFKNDPELKSKAYDVINTNDRVKNEFINRSSKKNYNVAAGIILQRSTDGQPFLTVSQMENDPAVKPMLSLITNPKEIQALRNLIQQPKDSNVDVLMGFQSKFQSGELQGMTPEDFHLSTSGLNKSDKATATRLWMKYNSPATNDQQRSILRGMSSDLNNQLQAVGFVKLRNGRYNNADKVKLTEAFNELMQDSESFMNLNPIQIKEYVKKFAAGKAKDKAFSPSEDDDDENAPAKPFSGFGTPTTEKPKTGIEAARKYFKPIKDDEEKPTDKFSNLKNLEKEFELKFKRKPTKLELIKFKKEMSK